MQYLTMDTICNLYNIPFDGKYIQHVYTLIKTRDCRDRDHMVVGFTYLQLPIRSVPVTTDVVSSNLDQGELYNVV
jgi:hypothetical protein